MRAHIGLVLALTVSVAAGLLYSQLGHRRGYTLKPGGPAPSFRLPALTGPEVDLAALRGKVVVLNFWATWCPPCVAEMPSLERLHRETSGDGVVVLTVSVDQDAAALAEFVQKSSLTLPVLRDPDERVPVGLYRVTGYPETFIIDPEGNVRDHVVGGTDWSTPDAVHHIRAYRTAASGESGASPMSSSTSPTR
jgi:peroxiredoxin